MVQSLADALALNGVRTGWLGLEGQVCSRNHDIRLALNLELARGGQELKPCSSKRRASPERVLSSHLEFIRLWRVVSLNT